MIVLIPYINLLDLSWIIKCLFLRDMEILIAQLYCIFVYQDLYLTVRVRWIIFTVLICPHHENISI